MRTLEIMKLFFVGLGLMLGVFIACGSDGTPPKCTGATCSCPSGQSCAISESTCGASCTLDCANSNDCNGACGDSCSLKCTGTSMCTMTVGASASVDCSGGATCHITCTGSCSINCGGGSTCDVTCPGDGSAHAVGASGGCG